MALNVLESANEKHQDDVMKILCGDSPIALQMAGILSGDHVYSQNLGWVLDSEWEWIVSINIGKAGSNADTQAKFLELRKSLEYYNAKHRLLLRGGRRITWLPVPGKPALVDQLCNKGMAAWPDHLFRQPHVNGQRPTNDFGRLMQIMIRSATRDVQKFEYPGILDQLSHLQVLLREAGHKAGEAELEGVVSSVAPNEDEDLEKAYNLFWGIRESDFDEADMEHRYQNENMTVGHGEAPLIEDAIIVGASHNDQEEDKVEGDEGNVTEK